jgi:hypothetical protein
MLPAVLPPGCAHVHTLLSMVFDRPSVLLRFAAGVASLPFDFFIKTTGRGDLYESALQQLPLLVGSPALLVRTLLLNTLTRYYADLWSSCWDPSFREERWTKRDARLSDNQFARVAPEWSRFTPLRTDYERRQALVEIDVLVAMELGLTIDDLCTIYRIQFPVLRQNEQDTWYDERGRIVFTCSKAVPGVGFSRSDWEKIRQMNSGVVTRTVQDDTLPGGPRERVIEYVAPFDRCDRESDYATAWKFFDEASA